MKEYRKESRARAREVAHWVDHRGEWDIEADRKHWIDAETGLDCLIVRNPLMRNLCGYVGLPPSHPWYGKGYDDVGAEVHGSLTFSGNCTERICHGENGEPVANQDVWWLGFDCAHLGDLVPAMRAVSLERATYKIIAYVEAECRSLAAQARRAT